jgi:hypothetical protein
VVTVMDDEGPHGEVSVSGDSGSPRVVGPPSRLGGRTETASEAARPHVPNQLQAPGAETVHGHTDDASHVPIHHQFGVARRGCDVGQLDQAASDAGCCATASLATAVQVASAAGLRASTVHAEVDSGLD